MSSLTREQKLELYRLMRLNRTVEERLVSLYRQGKIVGGLYRSLGQEATSVGSAFALDSGDFIGPLIRNLGSVLARGVSPQDIFTQHMGRATSPSSGKDGTLHFSSLQRGIVGSISMLGELISVMAGVALAGRMTGRRLVCMTYIGDGGTSTGPFHEGMNFAAVQDLALVVIGENNQWAYSTPLSQQMKCATLADRARAYGVAAMTIDGNDVEAVHAACRQAVDRARTGGGVTFIESLTYRMKGHAEHDAQEYVDPAELARWARRDPIEQYAGRLVREGIATREDLAAIDARVSAFSEEELRIAEAAPSPDPAAALDNVYATGTVESEPAIVRSAEGRR